MRVVCICVSGAKKAVRPYYKSVQPRALKTCLQIGHMIKYLLTKLGWAEWENIWLSAMTSSQIFSHLALPLSQKVHNNFPVNLD